ncbi:MAG: hypothetical protein U0836_27580 [Pirellulales bacterium]
MHYKTIVLELLESRPQLKSRLQEYRQLKTTLELYAHQLQTSHQQWQRTLAQLTPASDARQLASEALELAVAEIRDRLSLESAESDPSEAPSSPTRSSSD